MRLIDIDKHFEIIKMFYNADIEMPLHRVKRVLDWAPTVRAIPIRFIEEQIEKTTDISNKDELDFLYAGNLSYLIKLWEKENGKD